MGQPHEWRVADPAVERLPRNGVLVLRRAVGQIASTGSHEPAEGTVPGHDGVICRETELGDE